MALLVHVTAIKNMLDTIKEWASTFYNYVISKGDRGDYYITPKKVFMYCCIPLPHYEYELGMHFFIF